MTSQVFCIIDTSSLKNASDIEFGSKPLFDWIDTILDVKMPIKVMEEVIEKYEEDKENWAKTHALTMNRRSLFESPKSLRFIEEWLVKQKTSNEYLHLSQRLDTGEKHCAALTLDVARTKNEVLIGVVLIDDSPARYLLTELSRRQGIAIVCKTPDILLLILNRTHATKGQILGALNDFYRLNRDRKLGPLKDGYVAEIESCWRESLGS